MDWSILLDICLSWLDISCLFLLISSKRTSEGSTFIFFDDIGVIPWDV